jgi:hypothetical protein
MNNIVSILITALLFVSVVAAGEPVTRKQSWTESYAVSTSTPHLEIRNIWGGVRVRTGAGDEIVVSISESRSAPDQALYEISLEHLKLDIEADGNGVSMIVGDREERWQHMSPCPDCRVDYQFDIQVPPDAIIDVGTVMDGRVDISGVTGLVSASNVNGSVSVEKIKNCDKISSINGRIQIQFDVAPQRDCEIETINGNITLDVPDDTSLDISADLYNGEIESDFPVRPLSYPATVERLEEDGRSIYRIQKLSGVRIGAGGPIYSVASINGDIQIRRN